MSTERDELAAIISRPEDVDHGPPSCGPGSTFAGRIADAILAAGYRKVEPIWEPTLRNDGVYEYTQTSTCDGSLVYNYRRLPRLKYEGEYRSWESYDPEARP